MDWAIISGVLLKIALTAAASVVSVLAPQVASKIKSFLDAHANNAVAKTALQVASDIVTATVADLAQTVFPQFKAKLEAGTLTPSDISQLTEAALARIKQTLGDTGMAALTKVLPIADANTDQYLTSQVKLAIMNMRTPPAPAPATGALGQFAQAPAK